MPEIRINEPGAGDWVMTRLGGRFLPDIDNVFSTHREDKILGGIVMNQYFGAAMAMHMAGVDPRWCNRELLWLVFDYGFNQVGCRKLLVPIKSDNIISLSMCSRGGWQHEATIDDVFADNTSLVIMSMTRETCPWLDYQGPHTWRPRHGFA